MYIKNREAIIEELAEMLIQFDKDCNRYQTDVYLYYDEENQTAKLDTFVNVGGNSWLDDDHYTIYCDKEHYASFWNWYQDGTEFADVLEIPYTELEYETRQYHEYDEETELDWRDFRDYLESVDEYAEKLRLAYNGYIDEIRSDYVEEADDVMRRFEEEDDL